MALNCRVVVSDVLPRKRHQRVDKEFWATIAVGVALGTLMVTGHSSIDSRFDSVDAQFDRVDAQFDRVDARFASIETRLDQMDSRIGSIDTRLDNIDRRLARVEGHLFGTEPEAEAGALRTR